MTDQREEVYFYPRFGGFWICSRENDRSKKEKGNRSVLEAHDVMSITRSLHDHSAIMFIPWTRGC